MKPLVAPYLGQPMTYSDKYAGTINVKDLGFNLDKSIGSKKKIVFVNPPSTGVASVEVWETIADFTTLKSGGLNAKELLKYL